MSAVTPLAPSPVAGQYLPSAFSILGLYFPCKVLFYAFPEQDTLSAELISQEINPSAFFVTAAGVSFSCVCHYHSPDVR